MDIPKLTEYMAATGGALREMQARIACACSSDICGVVDYLGMSKRAQDIAAFMRAAGYDMRLLDEDGESMISHGAVLPETGAITVQGYWDEDVGASVVCTFKHFDEQTTFVGPNITE